MIRLRMYSLLLLSAFAGSVLLASNTHAAWRVEATDARSWTLNELRVAGNSALTYKQGDATLTIPIANLRAVAFTGEAENRSVKAPRTRERAVRIDTAKGATVEGHILVVTYEGNLVFLSGVESATDSRFEIPLTAISGIELLP